MSDISTFNDRIKRIDRGKQWVPEGIVVHQKGSQRPKGPSRLNPISVLFGAVFGAVLVVGVRAMRFYLVPGGDVPALQSNLGVDAGLVLLVFAAVALLRRRFALMPLLFKCTGVAAAALGMHMAVHAQPDLWALAFSQGWVDQVIATTSATSPLSLPTSG
ncbi:hypothetical protein IV417_04895 [Alphaproteobacteria bacterium KMM 3653]|uniref:Uncharacterized protein n=1 Tax=Harenicola maris TaxID=2841044 RepID=A0AAP2G7C0_9RHOB|nr:hypothetical protein [Harenicola maris]